MSVLIPAHNRMPTPYGVTSVLRNYADGFYNELVHFCLMNSMKQDNVPTKIQKDSRELYEDYLRTTDLQWQAHSRQRVLLSTAQPRWDYWAETSSIDGAHCAPRAEHCIDLQASNIITLNYQQPKLQTLATLTMEKSVTRNCIHRNCVTWNFHKNDTNRACLITWFDRF